MKVYVKCNKNSNSGLVIGKSETFTKAIYGFSELGCEIIPYELLDDISLGMMMFMLMIILNA